MSTPDMEPFRPPESPGDVKADLIYLCGCAVNGTAADKARVDRMDLTALYQTAQRHMLTAVAAHALAAAGVRNPAFLWAKERAVRTAAMMDAEQAKILEKLESAGIWYMLLKGAVLRDYYPAYGIREMYDRDILIDGDRAGDVRNIMKELGFSVEEYDEEAHGCCRKPPMIIFEMHRRLMGPMSGKEIYAYYLDVKKRLLKDAGNAFGFHLKAEDFYVYQVVHEYKHFSNEGTGLRPLLDTYVYLKNHDLDMNYVRAEVKKLGIEDYERMNRSLALHLFGGGTLTDAEQAGLDYALSFGTYGREENFARNLLEKEGKKGYFLSRLTLPYARMLEIYPVLKKLPVLYPFCWAHRLLHALFCKKDKVLAQLKAGLAWKDRRQP
ncbi:MAG: nucleotidyltransferase family protein [Clostridia bacterium]|nr:nucleotidyltransferase family protein [Clostridia bacterium]